MEEKKYQIDNIDPLGQGVSKKDGEIIFIPKTLPGESGTCKIHKKRKKVLFGSSLNREEISSIRINPECSHFEECNGCDYLHTDYANEIEFKTNALKRHFLYLKDRVPPEKIESILKVFKAQDRFGYRNRLQLHYNKKIKKLGFIHPLKKEIVEIPNCLVAKPSIQSKLSELYKNQNWLKLVERERPTGHIEIYDKGEELLVSVNKPYAHGGFTQVNEKMNNLLISNLTKHYSHLKGYVFDLFGGAGNLTKGLVNCEVEVVDATPEKFIKVKDHQKYHCINLYSDSAPKKVEELVDKEVAFAIFDPPRSGCKNMIDFVKSMNFPKELYLINCECTSLTRDLPQLLEYYSLEEVHLYDLFPGTRHFETCARLNLL